MASIGLINLGILPLLLEAMTPAYAQHDQREQDSRKQQQEQETKAKKPQPSRPEREEKPQHEARPQGQPRQERPDHPEKPQPRPEVRPEGQPRQDRATRREPPQQRPEPRFERQPPPAQVPRPTPRTPQAQAGQHQTAWPARRARDWKTEHRTWQDRGGYRGYRIPEARFQGYFGASHGFRMFRFPLIVVGGYPRFQYSGLWFSVMDPWPEYWSDTWYGDDDLYIEYWGGGYYLLNRRHPMDRIAITVLAG